MVGVAAGGLAVNLAGLWLLHGGRDESLNAKGAWLHVLTDTLGSVQAIVAGGLIVAFGWNWLGPLASVLIGILVIFSSWALMRESVAVLMESAPGHVDVDEVRNCLMRIPGVQEVHDVWLGWTHEPNRVEAFDEAAFRKKVDGLGLHASQITEGIAYWDEALGGDAREAGEKVGADFAEEFRVLDLS